ncbi:hypothetical protein R1sor_007526 [Riccia sorocarpa]|uniref:Uncharacterized protein n=1 Tax=Riccia sorocarpa TaxID=122646 RepID=A0ABD3HUW7_9MARC
MANGTSRRSVSFGTPTPVPEKPVNIIISRIPWKPQVKHQCDSVVVRRREIASLHVKCRNILNRASKVFNTTESVRDMSRESYGRRVAWERSSFGSKIGQNNLSLPGHNDSAKFHSHPSTHRQRKCLEKLSPDLEPSIQGAPRMDQLIARRPPRDCFTATQANNLLNLVVSAAQEHIERHPLPDPRKPRRKKDEPIPPPALLPPFNLHVKQRPLPKSYYLGGSLLARRETLRLKDKDKDKVRKKKPRESLFVAGRGVRYDGTKPAEIPEGMGYQNVRKNVDEKVEEYHRNYQAKRELDHRVSQYLKEKRKTRESVMVQKERRHSEVKAALEDARRASQMTIPRRKSINLDGEKNTK